MRRARTAALRAAILACALGATGAAEASAAYQDTILGTSGLVSYWRLGEASGTTAVDAKGLQNGTLGGTLDFGQAGALQNNANTAINFNAQADTFSAPDRAEYDLNAFTIEFWVRFNSFGNTSHERRLSSKGAGTAQRNWLIGLTAGTHSTITYSYGDTGGVNRQGQSVGNLTTGVWYHVVVTHIAGQKLQLFINGALNSEATATTTPVTSTSPVGLASANGAWSDARYDEHAIYNRALTAAEVLQHYRQGIDGTPPNTTITANPANPTTSTSASFSFTSSEANSTFECKLDAGAYGACTSPKAYSGLAAGSHTFSVRATDQAGNADPTPATYTWTIDGGPPPCSPAFGSFGGTVFPPACWKPYGALAPWNQQLPATPALMSNSSQIVARIIGDISATNYPDNMVVRDNGLSGEPTYWSRSTDPLYTIHCTEPWGTCEIEGMQIRIPANAKPEAPSDEHMTVVDQASGYEYNFWNTQTQPLPPGGGTVNINWGGRQPVTSGDGNSSAATAASFGGLAGRLRAEEMAGEINHALNIVIDCSSNTVVFPVVEGHGGRACSSIGKSNVDAPPMGSRLQLNMTDAEIDALTQTDGSDVPEWRERIYRAMAKYGMFFGDTGVGGYFSVEYEAGIQYTSVGATDQWKQFAINNSWPRTGDNTGYVGFFRFDNVDWANRLRVIAPCVSQRTC